MRSSELIEVSVPSFMIPSAFIYLYENNHGSSEVTHFNFMSSWIDKASWLGWFASGESAVS
jgi:hypothetical protein